MLTTPGARACRHANDVAAFYRDVRPFLLEGKRLLSDGYKSTTVALHVRLDNFDSLPGLQAIQIGPLLLCFLGAHCSRQSEQKQKNQTKPRNHESSPQQVSI